MAHNALAPTTDFPWGITTERAAMLVADGHKTQAKMAEELGVGVDTLRDWKRHPEFKERVRSIVEATQTEALQTGVLNKVGRVSVLQELYQKMQQIVDERAADPTWAHIPGWTTGLLTHEVKGIGAGDNFQQIDVFEDNLALVGEMTKTLKHIAQELGQWVEENKTEHVVTKVEVVYEDMDPKDL